ncbi:MAG TPA: NAD-dependent epimerase/dehydratase family protein [Gaiellaceae bacterium]|nr:NAD-dependent epimerase/dehydratase family protein [Gaiellaceae bacterium]
MGRTVLVTGATGFVGAHVLARAPYMGLEPVAARGDLRDPETARALVLETSPVAVLHLASARARAGDDVWRGLADDLRMAGNVLAAVGALAPEAPVLIPGSAAQYGLAGPEPLGETAPAAPVGVYGAVKSVLEAACTSAALQGSVRVIWTRSFNHVGLGQGLEAPAPSWARQIAEAEASGGGVLRTGRLDVVRDFLDVRDVADAYLALVSSGAAGVVNVCSGVGVRLRDVAETLVGLSGASISIEHDPTLEREIDPPHVVGDPSRLRELTGWAPSIDLERSLRDVLEEWRRRVGESEPHAFASGQSRGA